MFCLKLQKTVVSTFLSQCVTSIQIEFGFALHLHPAFPLESQYGIKPPEPFLI